MKQATPIIVTRYAYKSRRVVAQGKRRSLKAAARFLDSGRSNANHH